MNDAAFTAMGLTAYYFYTLDKDYLNNIFEFLELNVNFFLDWRERENLPDGSYRYNLWSGAHEGSCEMNSPHVLASIKNILTCLLDGEKRGYISINDEKHAVWQDFFEHLPAYPIREYQYGRPFFRHQAMVIALGEKGLIFNKDSATVALEFIHPGEDMSFSSDEKIKSAARNTVDLNKSQNYDIFRQINNLPKIFIHAIRSGYDPHKVYTEFIRLYSKDFMMNYSVKDYNDTHGIEKAGGIEFINSMLISSDVETVKVFPNWLTEKNAQFNSLLARGAFLVSSKYNSEQGRIEYIEIKSLVQNKIRIYNEFCAPTVKNENGEIIQFDIKHDKNSKEIICFAAEPGKTYLIN